MDVEVCAFSLESCLAAQHGGAARVELCAGIHEGGTTPSAAQVMMARRLLSIELYVMIRPRGGDFLYSELEFEQMMEEVRFARSAGADGFVAGILLPGGEVDVKRVRALVDLAAPLPVTFHRAFDMTRDLPRALEDIIRCGCARVLTSGGEALAVEGIEVLRDLVHRAAGRVKIMAGSGVDASNAALLAGAGVDEVHLSARGSRDSPMLFRDSRVSMNGVPGIPEYTRYFCDETKVRAVVDAVTRVGRA